MLADDSEGKRAFSPQYVFFSPFGSKHITDKVLASCEVNHRSVAEDQTERE